MAGTTRIRRSKEERLSILDEKINAHKATIKILESKKDMILNPSPRKKKATLKNLLIAAKERGLSEEEIASKLGIKLD